MPIVSKNVKYSCSSFYAHVHLEHSKLKVESSEVCILNGFTAQITKKPNYA